MNDAQQNDRFSDILQNVSFYALAKRYVYCTVLISVFPSLQILSAIMLNALILNAIRLNSIMLNAIMLNAIMLNAIMLNAIMPNPIMP
jgi:hypothetical protein